MCRLKRRSLRALTCAVFFPLQILVVSWAGEQSGPPTLEATISSESIYQGESVTINWESKGADRVVLIPGNKMLSAKGELTFTPAASTRYVVAATNSFGRESQRFEVEVLSDLGAPSAPEIVGAQVFGLTGTVTWLNSVGEATLHDQMVYRVYYSLGEPNLNVSELTLLGEVLGENEFFEEGLPASSTVYFYVMAVDESGNESNLSKEVKVTTGSEDAKLKEDINLVDLEEIGVSVSVVDDTTILLLNQSSAVDLRVGDVVLYHDDQKPYLARVMAMNSSGSDLEVVVEQLGLADIFSQGRFDATFKFSRSGT